MGEKKISIQNGLIILKGWEIYYWNDVLFQFFLLELLFHVKVNYFIIIF